MHLFPVPKATQPHFSLLFRSDGFLYKKDFHRFKFLMCPALMHRNVTCVWNGWGRMVFEELLREPLLEVEKSLLSHLFVKLHC